MSKFNACPLSVLCGVLGACSMFAAAHAQPVQTVAVVNTATRPVPIYDVDAKGRRPYRCSRSQQAPIGVGSVDIPCDTVPAGFRLVIEHVSVKLVSGPGTAAFMSVGVGPEVAPVNSIQLVPVRVIAGSDEWLVASQAVTFYVEPGETPSLRSTRFFSATFGTYDYTLQGSLLTIR